MRLRLLRRCTWPERSLGVNSPIRPKKNQPLGSREIILGSAFQGLLPNLELGLQLALSLSFGADLRNPLPIRDRPKT